MRLGLFGSGKTGNYVRQILESESRAPEVFNSTNPPNIDALKCLDGLICFVPGNILLEYLPIIIDSKVNVVSGATGHTWPENLEDKLKNRNLAWISGSNFAIGMNLAFQVLKKISKTKNLKTPFFWNIWESHHIHKKDAPSGTALSWKSWLEDDSIKIESDRSGDVVGTHQLEISFPFEKITFRHESLDRSVFAQGAVWAMDYLMKNKDSMNPGLHLFEDIVENELNF